MEDRMKRFVLFLLVVSISMLSAQEIPDIFANLRHSARTSEGKLVLRYETTPELLGTNSCLYSVDGGAWTTVSPYQLNDLTYEALVPYNYGQSLKYRLRLDYEMMGYEAVAMHAAYLDSDTFPPTLDKMGWIATDATGDSMMVYSNKLDLTDTWFAATDNKFYSAMANVYGSFPTMNTYTSYNAYITTIVNTSAMTDSVAFAMVYSGIPVLLSSGLYKLTFSTQGIPTFARIGDITAQVSGGKLHMACNISSLTADPQFGPWPNEFNALAISSMTLSAALVGGQPQFGLGDYSTPVLMGFDKHFYNHAQNSLPEIGWNYSSQTGLLQIGYTDANHDFPLIATVNYGSGAYSLVPQSLDFSGTVAFDTIVPPGSGDTATIVFTDNNIDMVTTTAYLGTANQDDTAILQAITCVMPNPLGAGQQATIMLKNLAASPLQAEVYNLKGQKLATLYQGHGDPQGLELSLNTAGMPSGMYLLRVTQDSSQLTRKFIILK